MNRIFFLLIAFLFAAFGNAQSQGLTGISAMADDQVSSEKQIYAKYLDSLVSLTARYKDWRYDKPDTLANPYYFPLFASPTLYSSPVRRAFSLKETGAEKGVADCGKVCASNRMVEAMDEALLYTYITSPTLIRYEEKDLMEAGTSEIKEQRPDIKAEVSLVKRTENEVPDLKADVDDDWQIMVRKPNFWKFKSNIGLQIIQNYISENWYQGGESNYSWLTEFKLEAEYNNKQKVVFSNVLETKLGFISTNNDTKHKFRSNHDLLRLTNKLGFRATKHWYYTLTLQSWTQFYPGYRSNDEKVYSDFMSPFESIFSIGMEYKLSVKKFSLNATLSPFACDFKYVARDNLATSFGLKEGKNTDFSFGSNITAKYNWQISNNVSWEGRIYYYTNYDKTQLEWENTFNLRLNKYLTTKLFLYPRFDDSVKREPGESLIQFKEFLSFGLDVKF